MAYNDIADDWLACGVASGQLGDGFTGSLGIWDFRSKDANTRATFLFTSMGGGVGLPGSFGGVSLPSPSDLIHNRQPDLWSDLNCLRQFSVHDLNWSWGQMSSISGAAAVGYQSATIAAGKYPMLFSASDVSGWTTGVSLNATVLWGLWKLLSNGGYY